MLGLITDRERIARARPASATVVLVAVAVNALLGAALLRGGASALPILGALLVVPALALLGFALVARPQRGVLLLAALLPFDGLRALVPFPAGWKEALVLATLAATLVAPAEARGESDRRLPAWTVVAAALVGLAVCSAVLVGGTQGLVGLKVEFFYVLIAVAIWRCPLAAHERDALVSLLMLMGFITAVIGIAQQVAGDARLADLGWKYNDNIRFAGGYLRSFSTFNTNFPFALFLMLVVLVGLPCALEEPRRLRSQLFLLSLPLLIVALLTTITRGGWLGLAVGLAYLGFTRFRQVAVGLAHAAVIAVVGLVVVSSYSSAFLSQSSSEERFDLWQQNVAVIAHHPLGVGIGTTGSAAEKIQEVERQDASDVFEPDNAYFKAAF